MGSFITLRLMGYVSGGLLLAVLGLSAALLVARADLREANAAHTAELRTRDAEIALARSAAEAAARAAEHRHAAALAAVAQHYEQEKADAQARADHVVAELRAGNLRLHARWQAALATDRLATEAAARAGQPDATADDRAASAGRIVRAAAECDAQVRGLQRVVMEDRKLCGLLTE